MVSHKRTDDITNDDVTNDNPTKDSVTSDDITNDNPTKDDVTSDDITKDSKKTLLTSVILSSPGPIVVGIGLIIGNSTTQLADLFRRIAELLAIICAYVIYRITTKNDTCDKTRKAKLERRANIFIGSMMCVAGALIAIIAVTSPQADKGNVIPSLAIAILGVCVNGMFWKRYHKLNQQEANSIIVAQSNVYRGKTFVDGCVTITLLVIMLAPGSRLGIIVDLIGSIIVAGYMIFTGIQTARSAPTEEQTSKNVT